jgi:hypothetical protein
MKTSLGPDLATTEARLGHGKRPRPRGAGAGGCNGVVQIGGKPAWRNSSL